MNTEQSLESPILIQVGRRLSVNRSARTIKNYTLRLLCTLLLLFVIFSQNPLSFTSTSTAALLLTDYSSSAAKSTTVLRHNRHTISTSIGTTIEQVTPARDLCPSVAHLPPTFILVGDGRTNKSDQRTHWVINTNYTFESVQKGKEEEKGLGSIWPLVIAGDKLVELNDRHPLASRVLTDDSIVGGQELEDDANETTKEGRVENEELACPIFQVPSTHKYIASRKERRSGFMFGVATDVDRMLHHLPLWEHWSPRHPLDASDEVLDPETSPLPLILVLTDELMSKRQKIKKRNLLRRVDRTGMKMEIVIRQAERVEKRYFMLAEEMWNKAVTREIEEQVRTDWFVFMDDDTFFPDFDGVVEMLGHYDSSSDFIVGTLSEAKEQVSHFKHMAYGGAGIFVSRSLMKKMNQPGVWRTCMDRFGAAFGGDAMLNYCASYALHPEPNASLEKVQAHLESLVSVEEGLHQIDMKGDSNGFFNGGFLITSLHHLISWTTAIPIWHPSGSGDQRNVILSLGKSSKLIGGHNFGRRYILEEGRILIALGYSIVLYAEKLNADKLSKTEHTWDQLDSFHPTRAREAESVDKRTFYLSAVDELSPGVIHLQHIDVDLKRLDIIWDRREDFRGRKPQYHDGLGRVMET